MVLGKVNPVDHYPVLDKSGQSVNEEELVQMFAEFFRDKVDKLVARNPIEDIPIGLTYSMIEPFTPEEIQKAVSTFKSKKSSGPDEIPLLVVKSCVESLLPSISYLFSLITTTGRIPEVWRIARMKPIFKKGDKSKIENYRPISNLNSLSKVFERCVLNRVNRIAPDCDGINQHGFRSYHSTSTAAIEVQDAIASALDENLPCLVYSVDLSAAFDLVRPGIFVKKALEVIKEPGLVWLIKEFITKRKAFIQIGNSASTLFALNVGCPQGSTLGPKVFNIYCNDLITIFNPRIATLVSYADDSYVVVRAKDVEELTSLTKDLLKNHIRWLEMNGMVCNIEKTESMILGHAGEVEFDIAEKKIVTSSKMKVLGITFDDKLQWKEHIDNTVKRTNRLMHGLKHVRKYLDAKQMSQVTTAFYFSVLYYGCETWYHRHLSFHLKQRVRSCHYRALRLIYGNLTRSEIDQRCERSTPDEWADYSLAKMMARTIKVAAPRRMMEGIMQNAYSERRQAGRMFFFDCSKRKIGRQMLRNRLQQISRQMKFEWLFTPVNALRPHLKKQFFSYKRNQKSSE
jgi:hypothetical protein